VVRGSGRVVGGEWAPVVGLMVIIALMLLIPVYLQCASCVCVLQAAWRRWKSSGFWKSRARHDCRRLLLWLPLTFLAAPPAPLGVPACDTSAALPLPRLLTCT
jgi:hypothetical protein